MLPTVVTLVKCFVFLLNVTRINRRKELGHILKIKYSHKGAETRRESEGRGEDGRRPTDEGREDEWMIRMVG